MNEEQVIAYIEYARTHLVQANAEARTPLTNAIAYWQWFLKYPGARWTGLIVFALKD